MSQARLAIMHEALPVERLSEAIEADVRAVGEGCGGIASFVGVVRATHKGRTVRHLEYEAFEPLAVNVFHRIEQEIKEHWPLAAIGIHHRVGRLAVGEA